MTDFSQLSPWFFVVAPLVIIGGYVVFGLSGFGSTIFSVPILAHFLPVSFLVPLVVILDLGVSTLVGTIDREHLSRDELKRIVPWMLLGFVLGATVIVGVPDAYLRLALGIFSTVIGLHAIANPTLHRAISSLWAIPAGLVGGMGGDITCRSAPDVGSSFRFSVTLQPVAQAGQPASDHVIAYRIHPKIGIYH